MWYASGWFYHGNYNVQRIYGLIIVWLLCPYNGVITSSSSSCPLIICLGPWGKGIFKDHLLLSRMSVSFDNVFASRSHQLSVFLLSTTSSLPALLPHPSQPPSLPHYYITTSFLGFIAREAHCTSLSNVVLVLQMMMVDISDCTSECNAVLVPQMMMVDISDWGNCIEWCGGETRRTHCLEIRLRLWRISRPAVLLHCYRLSAILSSSQRLL